MISDKSISFCKLYKALQAWSLINRETGYFTVVKGSRLKKKVFSICKQAENTLYLDSGPSVREQFLKAISGYTQLLET